MASQPYTAASSEARPSTMVNHEEAILNLLSRADPEAGYIE
jgi:hypothetical protein